MADRILNILIIASWYKSDDIPTNGSFIEEQARLLYKSGHNIVVIHPYLKGTFLNSLVNRKTDFTRTNDHGIITYRIGVSPVFPLMRNLSYLKVIKKTLGLLKNETTNKFDIIHSHSLFLGGVVGYYLSKKWSIPMLHTEHTSGLLFKPNDYSPSDKILLKKVYNHAKYVFFVSSFFQREMLTKYNLADMTKFTVLPNVVNPIFFDPTDFPIGNYKVLMIGNFIEVKQHELIIDAWNDLHSKFPDAQLTLIGEGPLKGPLQDKVSKLGLTHSVNFIGRQSREKIKETISNHHLVVSCSKIETFGLTIAEAIALGRPVVATNSGGVSDIINHSNGVIVQHDTPYELSNRMQEVLNNLNNYSPANLSANLKSKFSEDIIYQLLMEKYSSIDSTESR
jgi:L-malate glycosyltransferase